MGLILGEFLAEKDVRTFLNCSKLNNPRGASQFGEKAYNDLLENVDELKGEGKGTLIEVIKGLLTVDVSERLTAIQALKKKCFTEKISDEQRSQLFEDLVLSQLPQSIEHKSAMERKMSVFKSNESTNFDLHVVGEGEQEANTNNTHEGNVELEVLDSTYDIEGRAYVYQHSNQEGFYGLV